MAGMAGLILFLAMIGALSLTLDLELRTKREQNVAAYSIIKLQRRVSH
jgi:hypothetical protein